MMLNNQIIHNHRQYHITTVFFSFNPNSYNPSSYTHLQTATAIKAISREVSMLRTARKQHMTAKMLKDMSPSKRAACWRLIGEIFFVLVWCAQIFWPWRKVFIPLPGIVLPVVWGSQLSSFVNSSFSPFRCLAQHTFLTHWQFLSLLRYFAQYSHKKLFICLSNISLMFCSLMLIFECS